MPNISLLLTKQIYVKMNPNPNSNPNPNPNPNPSIVVEQIITFAVAELTSPTWENMVSHSLKWVVKCYSRVM